MAVFYTSDAWPGKGSPLRIVSLVPSITETLADLGLDDTVAGITRFCVHPAHWRRTKKRIGGTKQVHISQVLSLQPDLIIANREENVAEQVLELGKHTSVWVTDIKTVQDALEMIIQLGAITGTQKQAQIIVSRIEDRFAAIKRPEVPLKAAYLIWRNPWMTVGGDTFIHDMMQRLGFENVFAHTRRYPAVEAETLQEASPAWVLLSSEPYPFRQKHLAEITAILPQTKVILADGALFSWYGSRLLHIGNWQADL